VRIVQKSVERCEYGGTIDEFFFFKVLVSLDAHSFSSTALLLMGGKTDDIFSRIRTHRRSVCIHFASIA
jgi:hypothetical protein